MRIEIQGHVSDPEVAWERLGDTDFMNRRADGGKVAFELVPRAGGSARLLGTMGGPAGTSMSFEETYNGWVRGRWFRQNRVYRGGPLAESRFLLSLDEDGGGVVPRIELELDPSYRLLTPAIHLRGRAIRAHWQQVLDGLPAPGQSRGAEERNLPTALTAAIDRWRPDAPKLLVDLLHQRLLNSRDHALRSLRAYELADTVGLDRHDVLAAMLRAVPAGLLEVYWSVRCVRCQGELAASTTLSNLADHADCVSCGLEVTSDLARSVEVLFAPHPGVFPRSEERFCTLFPTGAPSLVAALPVQAGAEVTEAVQVELGEELALGVGQGQPDIDVHVGPGDTHSVRWTPGLVDAASVAAGELVVEARNTTDAEQRLVLRDVQSDAQVVFAADIATVPSFRRVLGSEVLATHIRIGSRRVALLFTDLSGSTALYERLGDAAAYALVRDHFDLLRREVETREGELVKTIGDAVMGSFEQVEQALEAALAMRDAFDRFMAEAHPDLDVRLNVGVHVGMALAVHTDDQGLDWFGHHVNLAARTQGAARQGDLVITEAVRTDARVAPILERMGMPEAFDVDLKGIGAMTLHRWRRTP